MLHWPRCSLGWFWCSHYKHTAFNRSPLNVSMISDELLYITWEFIYKEGVEAGGTCWVVLFKVLQEQLEQEWGQNTSSSIRATSIIAKTNISEQGSNPSKTSTKQQDKQNTAVRQSNQWGIYGGLKSSRSVPGGWVGGARVEQEKKPGAVLHRNQRG